MGLEIKAEKIAKSATSQIGQFKFEFNWEHYPGEAPERVQGRGITENGGAVVDAMYHPRTTNFSCTFHNMTDDVDVSIAAEILKDLKEAAIA